MTCCAKKREIFFGRGAGCLQLGRVEMRKKKEKKKKEKQGRIGLSKRGYINFYRRIHRWNIPSVNPSAILTVNRTSQYGAAILNPSVIPLAYSSVNPSRCHTELTFLNPSVILSVKNTRNNLHVSELPSFFNSQHSVGIYRWNQSVDICR